MLCTLLPISEEPQQRETVQALHHATGSTPASYRAQQCHRQLGARLVYCCLHLKVPPAVPVSYERCRNVALDDAARLCLHLPLRLNHTRPAPAMQFKTNKIIYRRYAGLFFSMCVDVTDNELAYLESVHLFVEILDHYFSNVCELDLVFNFHKVGR